MAMTIGKDDDVPRRLRSVAGDWYDGRSSAMYGFWFGREVSAERLLKETRAAMQACMDDKQMPGLRELESFAASRLKRGRALQGVRRAVMACMGLGLEPWQVERAAREAVEELKDAVRQEDRERGSGGPKGP